MGRSQETFSKKEKEKKKLQKRKEKEMRKEERKSSATGGDLDSMMAYVDENGQISETPPDPTVKKAKIKAENIEIGIPKKEHTEEDVVREGKVAFYNDSKGYGFINDHGNGEKYFFHINGCIDEVVDNDPVTFELEPGQKGLNAVRVKKR